MVEMIVTTDAEGKKHLRPLAKTWWRGRAEFVRCPKCGHSDDIDGFDVLGADFGCVFCNQCNTEIAL